MKLKVIANHQGEGVFLTFKKGTFVKIKTPCVEYPNWYVCEIDGYNTYIPIHFVENNQLLVDYNPIELVIQANEIVELLELHYEWALVRYKKQIGWLPTQILKSISITKQENVLLN